MSATMFGLQCPVHVISSVRLTVLLLPVRCCPAGKRALKKVQPILGGFNKEDYATQRLWTKVWKHVNQLSMDKGCCA
jgi:hypothetical protein